MHSKDTLFLLHSNMPALRCLNCIAKLWGYSPCPPAPAPVTQGGDAGTELCSPLLTSTEAGLGDAFCTL